VQPARFFFSSIDGIDVEVTIADVTAILKCSHEPLESDVPWIDCTSMLTFEDIVSDMCEGQYANKHRNAASKAKIPQNLLFINVVLYRNVCPLGHKTQRRDMFLSALYAFHRGFWYSISRSYGDGCRNSGKKCTIGRLSTRGHGVCLSLFSSLIY
jgi:hypothetical protein